jgi:hypothetical protein
MGWWVIGGITVVIVAFAVVGQRFGWVDLRGHGRRGTGSLGGTIAGFGDEIFHPTKYEVQLERDRQIITPAPAPVPGDGDKNIFSGVVRIDL